MVSDFGTVLALESRETKIDDRASEAGTRNRWRAKVWIDREELVLKVPSVVEFLVLLAKNLRFAWSNWIQAAVEENIELLDEVVFLEVKVISDRFANLQSED